MKMPWWPRTLRDSIAFLLVRLAARIAESDQLYDGRRALAMNRKWRQPTMGGEPPVKGGEK